jgi:hypothetical protein
MLLLLNKYCILRSIRFFIVLNLKESSMKDRYKISAKIYLGNLFLQTPLISSLNTLSERYFW